ncbi:hypothetical protein SV7mr_15650 [Stieleria bergensis]|uniref:Uncharacterized protein n=1 Tax=Stieleria bergensis TaxID=2528025 RepID=A0A517SSG8_9BACT|nr:hypothetical protein SV7mr_15650 [Planctomycetes bacterium SV_7m_r]
MHARQVLAARHGITRPESAGVLVTTKVTIGAIETLIQTHC